MVILSPDTKKCMSHLLLSETFDDFSFIEGEITTSNTFTLDGYLHKEFFEEPPARDYSLWEDLREYCFSIIKGKRTPLNFKLIFSLAKTEFPAFLSQYHLSYAPEDIQGLYLNFRYDGAILQCITGTSMNHFSMDKSIDGAWDMRVSELFAGWNIPFELI